MGQNNYELSYTPLSIFFLSALDPSPRLWSFMSGRMSASAKSLLNWTMETSLLWWRWSGGGGRAGMGIALQHWQGFSGWFSVDWFTVYSATIVCNVLCTLNLNCSKLNYRDQTAHISIRTTKYCPKSHRDTSAPARMSLYTRKEGEGALKRIFD